MADEKTQTALEWFRENFPELEDHAAYATEEEEGVTTSHFRLGALVDRLRGRDRDA